MKTTILTICLAVCTTFAAQAQDANGTMQTPTFKVDRHACIMASEETWRTIGLNPGQIEQVKDIQEATKQGRLASKDVQEAMASLETQEAALNTVLTAEQHAKYTTWCQDQHGEKVLSDGDTQDGTKPNDDLKK